jgi:hypothetical protein
MVMCTKQNQYIIVQPPFMIIIAKRFYFLAFYISLKRYRRALLHAGACVVMGKYPVNIISGKYPINWINLFVMLKPIRWYHNTFL